LEKVNMSCWVVPSIAAELWGVPVQQVLDGMHAGHIPSKQESGFTFVDVAPNSPKLETPRRFREPTPPTFTMVSPEELAALTAETSDTGEQDDSEDQTIDLGDWRKARQDAQRHRRGPLAA
jgi:hypothetical protein